MKKSALATLELFDNALDTTAAALARGRIDLALLPGIVFVSCVFKCWVVIPLESLAWNLWVLTRLALAFPFWLMARVLYRAAYVLLAMRNKLT